MNTPEHNPPTSVTPPTPARIRRGTAWKRLLFILLAVAAVIVLFYGEEKLRGRFLWKNYRARMEAQGYQYRLSDVAPPIVADESNFALQPALAPLFDFEPGTQKWRDTNAYKQLLSRTDAAVQRAKELGCMDFPGYSGNWRKAEAADMNRLLSIPDQEGRTRLQEQNARLIAQYNLAPSPSKTIDLSRIPEALRKKYNLTNIQSGTTNLIPIPEPMEPSAAARQVLALFTESPAGAILDELQAARRQRADCRFNLCYDYPNPAEIRLPHLVILKRCAQSYRARALARLQLGQADAAFEDALMSLTIGECLRTEPILISHLVRIACREIAYQPIWEGLAGHHWTAAQLVRLQAALEAFDLAEGTRRAINGERILAGRLIDGLRSGAITWNDFERSLPDSGSWDYIAYLRLLYPKGWLYHDQIFIDRFFISILSGMASNNGTVNSTGIVTAIQAVQKELAMSPWKTALKHRLVAQTVIPGIEKAFGEKWAIAQAANDLALVACALERHRLAQGRYPDNLEGLDPTCLKQLPVDVMNGQPLNYRRKTDGTFLLYSVGLNLQDEEGLVVARASGNVIPDKGDWAWQYTTPRIIAEKSDGQSQKP